ncbi:hypothetical protein FRC08_016504 [Ceratobasidium sp. 394]|nr:hypothetical protein FRC08_016504 [Ceratobasidium sp. 394]
MSSSNFSSLLSLPVRAGTRTIKSHLSTRAVGLGKLPVLITRTNTLASLDAPRVTNITVSAHKLSISTLPVSKAQEEPEAGVYKTLDSTTRFAIIVPLSVSRAHVLPFQPPNEQDPTPVVPTSTRPKGSITVQRLGMQTPSPPWAVRHMLTRGSGRFSLMSLPEFHRPASERLAVRYVEGRSEVVAAACPKLVCHGGQTLDTDLVPEQLKTFKHLVAERIRPRHTESMDPLKLAIHNNLARLITSSSLPRHQVERPSVAKAPKSKDNQRMRRTRPALQPLDIDAARAYMSINPTSDSPPESPGPVTPADGTTAATQTSKEPRIAKHKVEVSARSSKRGIGHRVHSKGSRARMGRRF